MRSFFDNNILDIFIVILITFLIGFMFYTEYSHDHENHDHENTIQWSSLHSVLMTGNDEDGIANLIRQNSVEVGFRDDGVIVWRYSIKSKLNDKPPIIRAVKSSNNIPR